MLLILPPGEKIMIEDQVYSRIIYDSLFDMRAVIVCFSFCFLAKSLSYKIMFPAGKSMILYFASGREAYNMLVEYALRLIQTYGNELCSALGGWLKSASFVCMAVSAV